MKVIVVQDPLALVLADSDSEVLGGEAGVTVMVADALTLGALLALSVAVFFRVLLQVELVPLEMCTVADAPGARFPKVQARTCDPTDPVMAHVPGPL